MNPTLIQLQTPSAVKKHLTLSYCKQTAGSRPHDPTNALTSSFPLLLPNQIFLQHTTQHADPWRESFHEY